jgi:predicted RNase H-like HicB family nuclease
VKRRKISMRFYRFDIAIKKESEDAGCLPCGLALPGCFRNGRTIEEAKRKIRKAARQHVASLAAHEQPIG